MEISAEYTELFLLVIISLISDIRTFKIKNIIIAVFMAAGLLTGFITAGINGLACSALAAFLPVPLLIIFYIPGMLGAGDIKLFCAIGAITGARFVLYSMAYSFIAGGLIALAIMLLNKSLRQRGKYLFNYLRACFLTGSFQPYADISGKKDGAVFRFSYAVFFGVLAAFIQMQI